LPEHFVEQRGKRPERWSAIDYTSVQVSFSGGQRVPLQPGSQDRLSMLLQLGLILRAQPQRLAAGQSITIPELGSRSIDAAVFGSEGNEVLETPSGPLQTVHLVRRDGDPARDPKVDVWLGYDHHFKPVRIRLTDRRSGARPAARAVRPGRAGRPRAAWCHNPQRPFCESHLAA
jgi:hypothetical protein